MVYVEELTEIEINVLCENCNETLKATAERDSKFVGRWIIYVESCSCAKEESER